MLLDKLKRNNEFDKLEDRREKELEYAQMAEYQALGITMKGNSHYYKEQQPLL
ncbi:MAG: hypothetical protein HFE62_05915 [Firmicutes bacterium]|nr:hypothetical protein [Bacillota bacterium]